MTNNLASRVASRFLEASRANRTHWLLEGEIHNSTFEVTSKDFKGLFQPLAEAIHEAHSYGNGAFDFQFKRGDVENDGTLYMEYHWIDGSNRGQRDYVGMTLYAENSRERTTELAKPKDISNFKKFLQGKYFGDSSFFYGDRVR